MFVVTISKADGSMYWKEMLSTQAEANKWISVKQLEPSWNIGNTFIITDTTAADNARAATTADKRAKVKAIDSTTLATVADIKLALHDILALLND